MSTLSWREERRRDRMAEAQISREAEAARVQARIAEAETRARLDRGDRQARRTERIANRKQRAARRADLLAWFRGHVTDLLFVPVIAVPGTLAWSAMAAFGHDLYGLPGFTLPAFSEGAMWVFEACATWIARRDPERPVWHLELGSWVFAVFGAALNFLHGLTVIPGHPHGVVPGAVMALISVAGLVAHQLVNLGPRRTRAARLAAKLERSTARREQAVRRAALGRSVAAVDAHGNARVVFESGTYALSRKHGRARLEVTPSPCVWLPWPMVLPGAAEPAAVMLLDMRAAEAMAAYRGWHSAVMPAPSRPVEGTRRGVIAVPSPPAIRQPAARQSALLAPADPPSADPAKTARAAPAKTVPDKTAKPLPAGLPNGAPKAPAAKRRKVPSSPSAKRAEAERLLRATPGITNAELVRLSGVSERTVARIRREMPRHLHVAGG